MIISALNYIETVSEVPSIVGGDSIFGEFKPLLRELEGITEESQRLERLLSRWQKVLSSIL